MPRFITVREGIQAGAGTQKNNVWPDGRGRLNQILLIHGQLSSILSSTEVRFRKVANVDPNCDTESTLDLSQTNDTMTARPPLGGPDTPSRTAGLTVTIMAIVT